MKKNENIEKTEEQIREEKIGKIRLTASSRLNIARSVNEAMNEKKMTPLRKKLKEAGDEIIAKYLTPHQRAMAKMPVGFFEKSKFLEVAVKGIKSKDSKKRWDRHFYYDLEKEILVPQYIEVSAKEGKKFKDVQMAIGKLNSSDRSQQRQLVMKMNRFRTVRQLIVAFPECESYIPESVIKLAFVDQGDPKRIAGERNHTNSGDFSEEAKKLKE